MMLNRSSEGAPNHFTRMASEVPAGIDCRPGSTVDLIYYRHFTHHPE